MKKLIITSLLAIAGFAAIAQDSTPDGCMPGNGGSDPICTKPTE